MGRLGGRVGPIVAELSELANFALAGAIRRSPHHPEAIARTAPAAQAALKQFEQLPVWVVVRLCTDIESMVQYWNQIDADVEVDMDVLDDVTGEAAEITVAPLSHSHAHTRFPDHRATGRHAAIPEHTRAVYMPPTCARTFALPRFPTA